MDRLRSPLLRGTSLRTKYTPLMSSYSIDDEEEAIPMVSMGSPVADMIAEIDDADVATSQTSGFSWTSMRSRLHAAFSSCFHKKVELLPRTVVVGFRSAVARYPVNKTCNQKFNVITFLPGVLYDQFKFFLNLYFLVIACSQFVPDLKVGYLYTYWAPLGFVLSITLMREAIDEIRRFYRDKEINSARYKKLNDDGSTSFIRSSHIQVSDVLVIDKDQRIPADLILLKTSEKTGDNPKNVVEVIGTCFVRTDQLDGETDWKLKVAIHGTQALERNSELFRCEARISAEKPHNDIHSFIGSFSMRDARSGSTIEEPLGIENALWADTVVASGSVVAVVLHTGKHTRSVMNTSNPGTKIGLVDNEINFLTKILFAVVILLAFGLIAVKGFYGPWYRYLFRFVILFSYIIPIGLRVNLDLGKIVYSWFIQKDETIPGTVVRSSTIPEALGRVNYLLSDKTGTLTQNEMIFKRLHLGTVAYDNDSREEIKANLKNAFDDPSIVKPPDSEADQKNFFRKKESGRAPRRPNTKVLEAVKGLNFSIWDLALALCHNVTPVYDENAGYSPLDPESKVLQAASPDEVALVKWAESVGLLLYQRDLNSIELKSPHGNILSYKILHLFPFTSESKRMGIIVRDENTGQVIFYLKGADVVMKLVVQYNDWLEEECGNMAREGLRTLVVAKKVLSEDVLASFESQLHQAKMSMQNRNSAVALVIESLEHDMELLCVTGVEDKLQQDVRPTLEMLGNAGIKVWMLTGDKLETATCIAKSSRLVSRALNIHVFKMVNTRNETHLELNAFRRHASDTALVITGTSLDICLRYYAVEFVNLACQCPAVVVCRCSPTQKAKIVQLLKVHTGKQICAIGDGGNDVSMIQAAHCGVGIVGKEGRQASLAADFSISEFRNLGALLMVHGRNSYKRSASLSQFVIHRGLIISVMQAIFSSVFYFSSVPLYQGFLMVGYPTFFTMFPVFSLVLDQDVTPRVALRYPELYRELHKGRSLSMKTFLLWVLISTYQGGVIMYGALLLFDSEFLHVVSISFTSLILTELIMVALTIRTWHWLMIVSEALSVAIYILSLVIFQEYFDTEFLLSFDFVWRVVVITTVSCLPLALLMYLRKRLSPPSYSKLDE